MSVPLQASRLAEPVAHGTETPTANGLYCAEIYFGWKLLEWKDGAWFHTGGLSRWTAGIPKQWVGPMPEVMGGDPLPKAKLEFDL